MDRLTQCVVALLGTAVALIASTAVSTEPASAKVVETSSTAHVTVIDLGLQDGTCRVKTWLVWPSDQDAAWYEVGGARRVNEALSHIKEPPNGTVAYPVVDGELLSLAGRVGYELSSRSGQPDDAGGCTGDAAEVVDDLLTGDPQFNHLPHVRPVVVTLWVDDPRPRWDGLIEMTTRQDGSACDYVIWWSVPERPGLGSYLFINSSTILAPYLFAVGAHSFDNQPPADISPPLPAYNVENRVARIDRGGRSGGKCAALKAAWVDNTPGEGIALVDGPVVAQCRGETATINMYTNGGDGTGTPGDDIILGTPLANEINGMGGNDLICGLGGNDVITGGEGDDRMYGDVGADIVRGNSGEDRIWGGPGPDRLLGGIDADWISGGDGNDFIGGFGGADLLFGDAGNDVIFGGFGADQINGGGGDDEVHGLIGDDSIRGDAGNDVLDGDRGSDVISGGDGDDTIRGGNASDNLFGGDGDDDISGGKADDSMSGGFGTDICTGNKHIIADTATSCEKIFGVP